MSPDRVNGDACDGFWLPRKLREEVLSQATWETACLRGGALMEAGAGQPATRCAQDDGAVLIRWPRLSPAQWTALLAGLQTSRSLAGCEAAGRWRAALEKALAGLAGEMPAMLPLLSASTGYTPGMLTTALAGGNLVDPSSLAAAMDYRPTWATASSWATYPRMGGRIRFYPHGLTGRARAVLTRDAALFRPAPPVDLTLGFAAGNVPGTAFIIALLGSLADHAAPGITRAPAVLVRNSRHEPLFTPWVLSAVEAVDPDLVAGMAVMIWDYDDPALQALLLRSAGLMLAAADDGTIAALESRRARYAPDLRFHRHGHKVSFATLGADWAARPHAPHLAALDSSFWDQNGCLSARVHFVEGNASEYAKALADEMRSLSQELPRGTTPRRYTHRAFDAYASLTGSGRVRLFSGYDEDFAVVLDGRPWDAGALRRAANSCQGRAVVVRPVRDVMDVPRLLQALPAANLQSISVLLDDERLEPFADAVGAAGVTALRSLGRGAFPQLAYSWDGLLPLDVCHLRPPGHFATIEPDPLATYGLEV
jgi:Acyl-CoA reductase (LuxC)